MNSAVSIWFSQVKHFTDQGCDQAKIDFTPMNHVMVLWRFSGHGNLSQGHMDIHIVKRFLLMLADSEGKIWLNDFVAKYLNSESDVKRDVMREDERERQKQVIIKTLLMNFFSLLPGRSGEGVMNFATLLKKAT